MNQKENKSQIIQDAIRYCNAHPELSLKECAAHLGITKEILSKWLKRYRKDDDGVSKKAIEEAKKIRECARLRHELQDTQDALEILKRAMARQDGLENHDDNR